MNKGLSYKILYLLIILMMNISVVKGQNKKTNNTLVGNIIDDKNKPIPYAIIWIKEINRSAITNINGNFSLKNLPLGEFNIRINCLGYINSNLKFKINKGSNKCNFTLISKSFALKDVVVTAKYDYLNITSSYNIRSDAIEHAQISNLAEMMSLLPGGHTVLGNLATSSNKLYLRSNTGEKGNPSFGTAIEIDGIRLLANSDLGSANGVDTRFVSMENIENIQVITGIPSAEYGDLTEGLIRLTTKHGVMPLNIKFSVTPKQKQIAFSKGFRLGSKGGVMNMSYDHIKSVSDIASPYTAYKRNAFTISNKKLFTYDNTSKSLSLSMTVAGNWGGYNSKSDPDNFKDTYAKRKAFNIRYGIGVVWRMNSKLFSSLKFNANINYSDNKYENLTRNSSSVGILAFHGTKEGYFVGKTYTEGESLSDIQLLNRGYWKQIYYDDSKPINYGLKLKIIKKIKFKRIFTSFVLGSEYNGSGNYGRGEYYANKAYIPTWREYKYSNDPNLNNLSFYAEEKIKISLKRKKSIEFLLGLRNDNTFVKTSQYGNVSALSPRFNFRHTFIGKGSSKYIKDMSWYVGWGQATKLPSFNILYHRPSYSSRLAFVPASLSDGTSYYSYYIEPSIRLKNLNLKWQRSSQFEIGINGKIKGFSFSVVYYNKLLTNTYTLNRSYKPFTYHLTMQSDLSGVNIPYKDRIYSIDNNGTVTVKDKNEVFADEIVSNKEKHSFKSSSYYDNGSPVRRKGIEWVFNFDEIKSLHTSLRVDGKFYSYYYMNKKIMAECLGDNYLMSNGQHYQYIGYYYGSDNIANGNKSKLLSLNGTLITHIPKLRLIVSLRVEGTFINSEKKLSYMPKGLRVFKVDDFGDDFPSISSDNSNTENSFMVLYPLYYTSFEDMTTKIPFKEKYIWAYNNDKDLFSDLKKMVHTSNTNYYFKKRGVSSYFSSNINVSKEIGEHFMLTFYAKNFLNTMAKVKNYQDDTESSLLNSGLVVSFNYGLSLKIKL